jgi:hypothetical protein
MKFLNKKDFNHLSQGYLAHKKSAVVIIHQNSFHSLEIPEKTLANSNPLIPIKAMYLYIREGQQIRYLF